MFYIGVDGGGTGTRAAVIDDKLQVLGRGAAGSSNHYSVGLERAAQNILQAVEGAMRETSLQPGDIAGWGLGLAGACTSAEQTMIHARLAPGVGQRPLVVAEDTTAAQAGAFGGGAGAVCNAGTGAFCFGVNEQGEIARADGLGPLLGDRGSGYWIGESALRALCRANDGSGPETTLLPEILEAMRLTSVDELVQQVYSPDFERDRIAAVVPVVVRCAAAGDAVAADLLKAAGRELAATSRAVMLALGVRRVAVIGGVLSPDSPVRPAYEAALATMVPGAEVGEPQHDSLIGAALLVASGRS